MAGYRVFKAFESIPEIMGLSLQRKGEKWEGPYYINGERHPYRSEKLKVTKWKDDIWVFEEGGEGMSLTTWLQRYGGAADYWAAVEIIEGKQMPVIWHGSVRKKTEETQYILPEVLRGARAYDLRGCSLYRWMSGLFGEEAVKAAWEAYNVTTDSKGNCVYWYTDQEGRILFDKRILYKEDGHRDKSFFPGRKYRVGDGYSGKCYFGAHLVKSAGDTVYVVESEKSALLFYLRYGKICLATGGKNNLREVSPEMMLLPDLDARAEWEEKGNIVRWWEWMGDEQAALGDHADIGDLIEYQLTHRI